MSKAEEENQSDLEQNYPTTRDEQLGRQYLAGIAVNLAAVAAGTVTGWSSPALEKLGQDDSPIPITSVESGWIGSLMALGGAVGPLFASLAADKLGRKRCLLIFILPILISDIILAAGRVIGLVYFARIFAGLALGSSFPVIAMYGGEIASDSIRGAIGTLLPGLMTVGIFYAYAVGFYVPYTWISISIAIVPILFIVVFMWMPESPYYYAIHNNEEEGIKSLAWLRHKSKDEVAEEYKMIKRNVQESMKQKASLKELVSTKGNVRALIICCGLMGLQQFTGLTFVLLYSSEIFAEAGGSLEAAESAIISGGVMMMASLLTPFLVDRLGRKILLYISAVGMCVTQMVLGTYFYFKKMNYDVTGVLFLPLVSVIVFIITYSLGFGSLPWAILSETFPSNVKSLASAITASFGSFLSFLIAKFFVDINVYLGSYISFWLFGSFCFLAIIFVAVLVPETKGKSLAEIQEILNR